jgi:NAD+ kinase
MNKHKAIGIIYNPRVEEARAMANLLVESLNLKDRAWLCPATEVDFEQPRLRETGLIITVGGDGTILRAVRLAAPAGIPLLGINLGRLGFMTELKADEALEKVPLYLEGTGWVEERMMLQAEVVPEGVRERAERTGPPPFHALNDVVLGRGAVSRLIRIKTVIDGALLTTYRADAVIVATATGSTGYILALGGPVLYPQSKEMVLKPVAPHLGLATALILPQSSKVELTVETDHQSMLSVDGYVDLALASGDRLLIQKSPYVARFLRANPPAHFYATLMRRLGLGHAPDGTRAVF